MSCNNKHDFPFATTVVGEVKDSFMASVGFENGKYLKLGNVLTVAQIGGHAYHGEWENVAQDVGVWAATTAIALAIAPVSVPAILATGVLTLSVNYSLNKIIDGLQCPPDEPNPDPTTPFLPDPNGDVKNYTIKYYDPIVVDINNNGIKTINTNGYFGALFDHDGDGIRTATGWVDKEDGLLVRDIDGNGKIDNGKELFGDNTILQNNQKATNGMEALADLDSNGDGIIDNKDIAFNSLKVWQDLNGDGISSSDELITLADAGITSINLKDKQSINQKTEGGFIKESATFTKADGSTSILADVNFNKDTIHSRYQTKVALSDTVAKLPNVYGSGRLLDIQQAAMKSNELAKLLEQYIATNSRSSQQSLLDKIMLAWAATDPQYTEADIEIMRPDNMRWQQSSDSTNIIYLRRGEQIPEYLFREPPPPQKADAVLEAKVKFVDAMLGITPTNTLFEVDRSQIASFTEAYDSAKTILYKSLLNQTILKPYLEAIDVYTDGQNMVMTFDKLTQLITTKYQTNALGALEDLKDLLVLNGAILQLGGWEQGFVLLQQWKDNLSSISAENKAYIDEMFKEFDTESEVGTKGNDFVFLKNELQTKYSALKGNDTVFINTATGQTVEGRCGDDIIIAGKGNDYLVGGTGRNTYIFYKGVGEDIVNYDNNYTGEEFDKLAFLDVNVNEVTFYSQDKNLIVGFGSDKVTVLGVLDTTSTKNILLQFKDQTLTLQDLLKKPLQSIVASDGEEYINGWKGADILTGNNSNNQIFAFDGDDTLTGGEGNDRLKGGAGIDTYNFSRGDGIDEILEDGYSIEANRIVFKDINPIDIQTITFQENDLVIQYNQNDKIFLKNYIANSQDSALSIKFANGTVWQNNELMAKVTFEGGNEADIITGTLDNHTNIINAHAGNDTVHGNRVAQNIIDGGDGWDELHGGDKTDTIKGGIGEDFIYGEAGNDHIDGGADHDTLFGGDGDDTINGGNGNDWLQGDTGKDILVGGLGDDSYDVDALDTIIESPNEGYDAIFIANDFNLAGSNLEEIHLKGNGNFKAIGDAGNNGLYGNEGNNYLDGKTGADIMAGGAGDDYYVVDKYEMLEKKPDGTINFVRGDQVVEGILHENYVYGDSGGNDTVEQWDDHHFYQQDEMGNWIDTGHYHHLQSNIENLVLKGQAKTAFGNALDNTIALNEQNNFINALGGNDTIIYQKGGGNDTIVSTDSTIVQDTLVIQGYDLSDAIFSRVQNTASKSDMLQIRFVGSKDTVTLLDYYALATTQEDNTVDNKIDRVIFQNNGKETILTQAQVDAATVSQHDNHAPIVNAQIPVIKVSQTANLSYQFASNIIVDQDAWDKTLSYKITSMDRDANGQYQPMPAWLTFDATTQTLTGIPPKEFTGNLSLWYWGTDLFGNSKATSFIVSVTPPNQAPVVVNAIADQTINFGTAFSYNIPSITFKDPEGDTITYTATLEDGGVLPNWLVFNQTTRTFSGTAPQNSNPINVKVIATDTFKNSTSDVFTINFVAPNLTIRGTNSADTLTGKEGNDTLNGLAGNDTLIGGAGNDKLDGGTGADKMTGGVGDDTYIVDNVSEYVNEGTDTVQSSVTYTLGNNLENLTLLGTGSINGTGNALDNILKGNQSSNTLTGGAGNDILDGGLGADKLIGGTGNDTYVLDNTGDIVIENTNEGIDTVQSSITYTLGSNLENLILLGVNAINGTGNSLNNTITGNNANNTLTGDAGDDILDGGLGNDSLTGGTGNDTYIYRANQGVDSINNSGGGTDSISFVDVNDKQLSYHKDGNDLVILVDQDLGQQVRVKNHFVTTTDNAIDKITTQNGISITSAMITTKLTTLPSIPDMSGNNVLKDTLGNDTLAGAAGNDTYYHTGGKDVIIDTAGIDTLIFGNGITYNQVGSGLLQSGNDLILRVDGNSNNEVTLTNFFKDASSIVETISFETGGHISAEQIYSLFGKAIPQLTPPIVTSPNIQGDANNNDLIGKSTDDTIQGLAGNDRLQGLAGHDKLEGGAGNDILVGGIGNDTLIGGLGNDLYYFKVGFGQDTIVNTGGGVDNIYLDGLTFNQLSQGLLKSGNDLTLKVSGSTDQLTLKDFFLGGDNAGMNINFSGGGSLSSDQIFGAYGQTNPVPSKNIMTDYQYSLSTMLNLMDDYNKVSPLASESTVL